LVFISFNENITNKINIIETSKLIEQILNISETDINLNESDSNMGISI